MFPAPFSQIATMESRRVTYKRQFPLTHVWPSIIIMVIFMTVPSAVGNGDAAECPANCSCSTVESYVNRRAVKCSYIGLSDVPGIKNPSTIHSLDLSNNKLSLLKNVSFSSYSSLSILILSYNKVEEIEINAFAGLGMIREIDLSYNKLQSFDPNIFSSNLVLQYVSLQGNNLVNISSNFPIINSNSVWSLDLVSCYLTTIYPETFSGLPSLSSLYLRCNKLKTNPLNNTEIIRDKLKMNDDC